MKRNLLIALGVMLALPTFARDFTYQYEGKTLTYTVLSEEDKTVTTKDGTDGTSGNKVTGEVKIPATVYDANNVAYTVTAVGYRGFANLMGLTSVIIPNTVTSIGDGAFIHSEDLASLIIPNSVITIGEGICCFNSALTSIVIPESVTKIGEGAFSYCTKLNTVWLPGSLTSIGEIAFNNSNLIKSVYYNTEEPLTGYKTLFSIFSPYNRAVLYVPSEAAVEKCKETSPWMYFYDIQVYHFSQSAVDEIMSDEDWENMPMFDLYGRKISEPQKGQIYVKGGKKFIQN